MKEVLLFIVVSFFTMFFALTNSYSFEYTVTQLTENTHPETYLRINSKGESVWLGHPVNQPQIYYYNGNQISQLTNDHNSWNSQPDISENGYVVWVWEDAYSNPGQRRVCLYDGSSIKIIANPGYLIARPSINNTSVIYSGRVSFSNYEILLYNGSTTTMLTDNTGDDDYPQINQRGHAVWQGWVPYEGREIFYFDGFSIIRLSNNNYLDDSNAQINDNGYVVWHRQDIINSTSDYNIYLYDGVTTKKISTLSGDDQYPKINSSGWVVWHGHDGSDREIFLYDGKSVIQLTDNAYDDAFPEINDKGYVVWKGFDGNDYEIFFFDGSKTIQITDNSYDDGDESGGVAVQVDANGNIFWIGSDGTDSEVFFATSPPCVVANFPANGATEIEINSAITAKFSEDMDISTINSNTILVDNDTVGSISYNSGTATATFLPTDALKYSTTYTVTITTVVTDLNGNPLRSEHTWSFTTGSRPDEDTDDDGILNIDEDIDQNGIVDPGETDPQNADSDGDGIQDGTEIGLTLSDAGSFTNLAIFRPDLDPTSKTDPLNPDTDGDGPLDGQEDKNANGKLDAGETDPIRAAKPGGFYVIPILDGGAAVIYLK